MMKSEERKHTKGTRIWGRRILLGLGLVFSLMSTNVAQAEGKSEPDPRVEEHYNAGVAIAQKARNKQDWEKACEEFTQAFALEKNPLIAANLGHAELEAGRMRLAAEHLDYFLRVDKDAPAKAKKEIEGLLEQAKKHIVTVNVVVNQVGATIVVDNIERGVSPLESPIYLEENEHTFEVRQAGMKTEKQSEVFKKGDKRDIKFEMVADVGRSIRLPGDQRGKGAHDADWRNRAFVASIGLGFVGLAMGGGFTAGFIIKHSTINSEYGQKYSNLSEGEWLCPQNFGKNSPCSALIDATEIRNSLFVLAGVGYALSIIGFTGSAIWGPAKIKHHTDNHAKLQVFVTPNQLVIKGAF